MSPVSSKIDCAHRIDCARRTAGRFALVFSVAACLTASACHAQSAGSYGSPTYSGGTCSSSTSTTKNPYSSGSWFYTYGGSSPAFGGSSGMCSGDVTATFQWSANAGPPPSSLSSKRMHRGAHIPPAPGLSATRSAAPAGETAGERARPRRSILSRTRRRAAFLFLAAASARAFLRSVVPPAPPG